MASRNELTVCPRATWLQPTRRKLAFCALGCTLLVIIALLSVNDVYEEASRYRHFRDIRVQDVNTQLDIHEVTHRHYDDHDHESIQNNHDRHSMAETPPVRTISSKEEAILKLQDEYMHKIDEYLRDERVVINRPAASEFVSYADIVRDAKITFVITSCKRFSVLSQSIESFERYNTYPHIGEKVVLDDCSNESEISVMRQKYGKHTGYNYTFLTNKIPKVAQITGTPTRSILNQEYLVEHYVVNKSEYYFKSEDDWIFYKSGFIEDSFAIKYGAPYWYNKSLSNQQIVHPRKILSTSLQNLQYPKLHESTKDVHATCGGVRNDAHGIFAQYFVSPVLGYRNQSVMYAIEQYFSDCFGSYTNRPTLQHIDDYLLIKRKYGNYTHLGKASFPGVGFPRNAKPKIGNEKLLACAYKKENYALATTVYNGYAAHGCSTCHVDLGNSEFDINFSSSNETYVLDYEMFTEHCLPKTYYNHTL